jgi:hypothetical protein
VVLTPAEYYAHPAVRTRVAEYCGAGASGLAPTCVFISCLVPREHVTWEQASRHSPADLPALFESGHDLARSLWDRRSLVVHLDIDYMDPDAPGRVFLDPHHAFDRLEPLRAGVTAELEALELPLLSLMTGRGFHFTGIVPLRSDVCARLARIGAPALTREIDERVAPRRWYARPPVELDTAALGLGMALEYLAHRLLRRTARACAIPLVVDNADVGRGGDGREALSIDLSYAGDPLESRQIRTAYSTYQNPALRPDIFGEAAAALPPFAAVPVAGDPIPALLDGARALEGAAERATRVPARLPDVRGGMSNLVESYERSPLAAFHRDFYSVAIDPPDAWSGRYDRLEGADLAPCAFGALRAPNDALLKPAVVQHVTRALMADGWHPRHVAGLVLSRYARDFGWGDRWRRIDPARRADFDVRVFSGLLAAGADRAVDFNCVSTQEKGLCPLVPCRRDLRTDRDRLLQRVSA